MDRHTRYVAQFHNADDEPVAARAVQMRKVKADRELAAKALRQRSRKASFENAGRLREMLEAAKGRLAAAGTQLDTMVDHISDLGTVHKAD